MSIRRGGRFSFIIMLSLYGVLGTAAPTKVPEVCSSVATSNCCYAACVAMAENRQYVHGDLSVKMICKQKCMSD